MDAAREERGARAGLRWAWAVGFGLALAAALVLRLWDLDHKPLHHDEGVNGHFLLELLDEGRYAYDPTNYHGPFLYYAGLLTLPLDATSPWGLRLPPALCGALLLAFLLPLRRQLGGAGVVAAAVLLAVSPSMVYVSRTAIHEVYLIAFSLAAVAAAARYAELHPSWRAEPGGPLQPTAARTGILVAGAVALASTYANKETAVITWGGYAAGAGAMLLLARGWGELRPRLAGVRDLLRVEWGASAPSDGFSRIERASAALAPPLLAVLVLFGLSIGLRLAIWGPASGNAWDTWTALVGDGWSAGQARVAGGLLAGAAAGTGLGATWLLAEPVAEWWRTRPPPRRAWLAAAAAAALVSVALFSSLFTAPRALLEAPTSLLVWVARGVAEEETGHEHPPAYFLRLLWRFEAPLLLLGVAGWASALWTRRPGDLFVAGWGASVLLVYSALPYKTPWLVLNLVLPLALGAGVAVGRLAERLPRGRPGLAAAAALAPLLLAAAPAPGPRGPREAEPRAVAPWAALTWDLNLRRPADDRYGLVYGQTSPGYRDLVRRLDRLLDGDRALAVHAPDYWPLPFHLHGEDVRYEDELPAAPAADLLLVSPEQARDLLGARAEGWTRERFTLRPGVRLVLVRAPP